MSRRIAFSLGMFILFLCAAFGQEGGQMVGVVTDSSGSLVPGATVKATEVQTGFVRSTITGGDGRYVFPALRPTEYEVSTESAGFRTFRRSGINLLANQSLTLNIALEV